MRTACSSPELLLGDDSTGRDEGQRFYADAVSRNIGLLTENEQEVLRRSTVAIAGMGAVGGNHLITLARMGVGGFSIADPDRFEVVNLHRQAGAFVHTIDRNKADAMADMVLRINPYLRMKVLDEPVGDASVEEFLNGADVVIDGIDFFEIDARRLLFDSARRGGLYVITSGPIGYGATLQIFDPAGMSFDEYFGIEPGMTKAERLAAFSIGATPKLPGCHGIDNSKVDFENGTGPALCSTVMLCAGLAATEALRILLGRGRPRCVPHAVYFNPYTHEFVQSRSRKGRAGFRDRLLRKLGILFYPGLRKMHAAETRAAGEGA
jgi:molybdopterin/thiamine biosynthesis adenylyltransferase